MQRVSWHRIDLPEDLKDGDVVRVGHYPTAPQFKVRVEEAGHLDHALRFKDIEDWNRNIHYHAGAASLVDSGLVFVRREIEAREGDIWTTKKEAWQCIKPHEGLSDEQCWIQLWPRAGEVDDIPEDADLLWRVFTVEGDN